MEDSILASIRELLIGDKDDVSFDADLVFDINTALNILTQVGVGPTTGFKITSEEEKWSDFITDSRLELVKDFVKYKVRSMFDPPTSSFVLENMNKVIDELLWRINVTVDEGIGGGLNV